MDMTHQNHADKVLWELAREGWIIRLTGKEMIKPKKQ